MRSFSPSLPLAAALAALACLASACKPPAPPAAAVRLTNVETWVVEPTDLAEEVVLPGIVEAETSVRVSAEVAAVVKERRFGEDDEVKAGDVLLEFDTKDLALMQLAAEAQVASLEQRVKEVNKGARDQQIREAEAGLEAAKSALELAQKVAKHREELFREKVIPEEMLDQARFQAAQAQAGFDRAREILDLVKEGALEETKKALEHQLDAARAQAQLAANQIDKATVQSPISGIVQKRFVEAREFAAPGMPLFEIVSKSPLKVSLGVPERIFARLKEGDSVALRFPTYGLDVEAKISRTGFAADPRTQTFSVEIRLDNPVVVPSAGGAPAREVLLRPGLIADARLNLGVKKGAAAVPGDTVVLEGSILFVYVVEKDARDGKMRAKARPVLLGMKREGSIEILSGLAAGERLVVLGQRYVKDGDEVNVVAERTGPLASLNGAKAK
jgi:HlyD family secretion protein